MVWTPAHTLELPLLNEAQDLALQGQGKVADLVEEEGAVVGHLRLPHLAARGARERSLLVAEELVLEQGLGDRRAVDGDERALRAGRQLVERSRHQLLAGAALPEDQHRGVAPRRPLDGEHRLSQGRVLPDHPWEAEPPLVLVLQEDVVGVEASALHRAIQQQQEVIGVDRLREEVRGAVLHGLHGLLDGPERGHHQDGRLRVGLERSLEDVEAAPGRQAQVRQDDEESRPLEPAPGLVGIPGLLDAPGARLQGLPEHRPERFLVFDDEDVGHGGMIGRPDGGGYWTQDAGTPLRRASPAKSSSACCDAAREAFDFSTSSSAFNRSASRFWSRLGSNWSGGFGSRSS